MIRTAKLDVSLYEDVEADRGAMGQAMTVVILSSLAQPFPTQCILGSRLCRPGRDPGNFSAERARYRSLNPWQILPTVPERAWGLESPLSHHNHPLYGRQVAHWSQPSNFPLFDSEIEFRFQCG